MMPSSSSITADQWRRLKLPLADLAELAPQFRDRALAVLSLSPEDREVLQSLVAALDQSFVAPASPPATDLHARPLGINGFNTGLRWQIGAIVAGYQIDGFLGRGGMGEVYAAHALADGEKVALKVLRQELEHTGLEHFSDNEQRALKRLGDPHIARFIEAFGLPAEGICLVLEQVDGEPLMSWCEQRRLDTDGRLELFGQICQAVASAHRQLVVHRDLKPGNVLVTASGQVKLLDFGVAKLLDEDGGGQTYGGLYTLAYAAPEQILREPVSTATDVYALGVLLFHLLSGASPYALEANESPVKAVLSDKPRSLTSARPGSAGIPALDPDLDRVIARAMEKDPRDRYPSAFELAADVQAIRYGAPISAGGSRIYRMAKFVRRNRLGVATAVVSLLTLIAATAISLHWAGQAQEQAQIARLETENALQVTAFLTKLFAVSDPGENRGERLSANDILEAGARRLDAEFADNPLQRGRMAAVIGNVFVQMGEYRRAGDILDKALRWLQSAPAQPIETSKALRLRAFVAARYAQFEQALTQLGKADALLQDDSDRATRLERALVLATRAMVHRSLGQLLAAVDDSRTAVGIVGELEGAQSSKLGAIYNNLALALSDLGRSEQAIEAIGQALEVYRSVYGNDHPRTLGSMANLALVLSRDGRDVEAIAFATEVVSSELKVLSGKGAQFATDVNTLGAVLYNAGRFEEAANRFAQAMRLHAEVGGVEQEGYALAATDLAGALLRNGEHARALEYAQSASAIRLRTLGGDHRLTRLSQAQIAEILLALGRASEAFESASAATENLEAMDPIIRAITLHALAMSESALDRNADARRHAEQAVLEIGDRPMRSADDQRLLRDLIGLSSDSG